MPELAADHVAAGGTAHRLTPGRAATSFRYSLLYLALLLVAVAADGAIR